MRCDVVVDTSALVALLLGEPQAETIDGLLRGSPSTSMSAANQLELMIVVETRAGAAGVLIAEELLRRFEITIETVTPRIARIAIDGWRRFGKGRHPAALNFGDCFSYALAIERTESLLFVGNDFSQTDVLRVIAA